MKHVLSLALLLTLAACATPVERCVNQATEVYREALDEQRELEATLARGYALREVRVPYPRFVVCETRDGKEYPCWRTFYRWETRRENVDLGEVRRRISDISARLPALEAAANAGAAQCRAAYPEG